MKLCVGSKCKWEIIEPEAGVVDNESIDLGNVLVQSIHPGPTTLSAGDFHSNTRQCI